MTMNPQTKLTQIAMLKMVATSTTIYRITTGSTDWSLGSPAILIK
jgi:hypothetical protein